METLLIVNYVIYEILAEDWKINAFLPLYTLEIWRMHMSYNAKVYKVFIASPDDVQKER